MHASVQAYNTDTQLDRSRCARREWFPGLGFPTETTAPTDAIRTTTTLPAVPEEMRR